MFIAELFELFTIVKIWKQVKIWVAKCPLIDECIKKQQYMYTMKYYLAIKKKLLPFVTAPMDLDKVK